ncbi:hypothetical protein TNCT_603231 [Trichonephila clavata]|uniref:Uncharacterized protein n=1 Tax=Trichonephila clavata TaxID=2740835 RepID=A0A8X6F8X2_TRICU|nr:hypothetical protein TNCT_603231 [Trichonephila clavata]
MKLGDHKLRTADRQISDSHSHGKFLKGNTTFQGTHLKNHNDARNSGKAPEWNFDKRKGSNVTNVGLSTTYVLNALTLKLIKQTCAE